MVPSRSSLSPLSYVSLMFCDSGGGSDGALSSCLPLRKGCLNSSEPQWTKANAKRSIIWMLPAWRTNDLLDCSDETHAHTDYAIFDVYLAIFMYLWSSFMLVSHHPCWTMWAHRSDVVYICDPSRQYPGFLCLFSKVFLSFFILVAQS